MEERKIEKTERPPSRYMKQMKISSPLEQQKMTSQQDSGLYQIQLCNMITSENAFAATMSMEIQNIQEEIKQNDLDNSIRTLKPTELRLINKYSKQHVKELKKWLFSVQHLNKETIDKKLNSQLDVNQILENINVRDPNEGVKKLFKILCLFLIQEVLELMIIKYTELETITLLKYEDLFNQVTGKKNPGLRSKINQLNQGVFLNKFSVFQANQERYIQLFDVMGKQTNLVVNQPQNFDQIKSTESCLQNLKNLCNSEQSAQFLHTFIANMDKKEKQLAEIIKEQEKKLSNQTANNQNQNTDKNKRNYLQVIDDMQKNFDDDQYSNKQTIENLRQKIEELNLDLTLSQKNNKIFEENLIKQQLDTQNIMDKLAAGMRKQNFQIRKNDQEDSYENALKEQMDNMRVGFLSQIANFQEEIRDLKKKQLREISDLKGQVMKEENNKKLLLRKLDILCPL